MYGVYVGLSFDGRTHFKKVIIITIINIMPRGSALEFFIFWNVPYFGERI